MKYIRFSGFSNTFHLFPDHEQHREVAISLGGRVVSAGCVKQTEAGLECTGESISLGVGVHQDDSKHLNSLFDQ